MNLEPYSNGTFYGVHCVIKNNNEYEHNISFSDIIYPDKIDKEKTLMMDNSHEYELIFLKYPKNRGFIYIPIFEHMAHICLSASKTFWDLSAVVVSLETNRYIKEHLQDDVNAISISKRIDEIRESLIRSEAYNIYLTKKNSNSLDDWLEAETIIDKNLNSIKLYTNTI